MREGGEFTSSTQRLPTAPPHPTHCTCKRSCPPYLTHPTHQPTRRVEGGEEGDVAVADADRVLDKEVGEPVGKAPAGRRSDSGVTKRQQRRLGYQRRQTSTALLLPQLAAALLRPQRHRQRWQDGMLACSMPPPALFTSPLDHTAAGHLVPHSLAGTTESPASAHHSLPVDLCQLHVALAALHDALCQLLAVGVVEQQAVALQLLWHLWVGGGARDGGSLVAAGCVVEQQTTALSSSGACMCRRVEQREGVLGPANTTGGREERPALAASAAMMAASAQTGGGGRCMRRPE